MCSKINAEIEQNEEIRNEINVAKYIKIICKVLKQGWLSNNGVPKIHGILLNISFLSKINSLFARPFNAFSKKSKELATILSAPIFKRH